LILKDFLRMPFRKGYFVKYSDSKEALAKVSNVHPPQLSHQRDGNSPIDPSQEHTPTPLSRGDLPSPFVGEG
jgi:hypothetical protein